VKENCEKISDLCVTWDNKTGGCISCHRGYKLKENGNCVLNRK
jgi:hypothetical protein